MSTEPKHPLLLPASRYQEYSVADFIKYCKEIRTELFNSGVEQVDREFLEKQFVNEMEPLAKMCGLFYGSDNQKVKVRHVNEQLADGIIVLEGATQNIFVEFTAAKDFYFQKFALSEFRQSGRLLSLTGHTAKDVPRLKLNAEDESFGDTEADFLERQEFSIREVIEKKLVHNWTARENWLCIVLDDVTNWHHISMTNLLAEIHGLYRDQLRLHNISMLWFVGYESWISCYPN